ncbi:hypothetical protein Tco_1160629 [Tanacetum coccineum]
MSDADSIMLLYSLLDWLAISSGLCALRSKDREEDEHWRYGISQGGSVKESLDNDLFYTFSDGKNGEAKKSTLGEAESPSAKNTDHSAKKDEAVNYKEGIEDDHAAKKEAVDDKEGIKDFNKGRKK